MPSNHNDELHRVAREAAEEAVREVLASLGIDVQDPIEVQKDLASMRELRKLLTDPALREDLSHLRRWRKATEAVKDQSLRTAVGVIIVGVLGLIAAKLFGYP